MDQTDFFPIGNDGEKAEEIRKMKISFYAIQTVTTQKVLLN